MSLRHLFHLCTLGLLLVMFSDCRTSQSPTPPPPDPDPVCDQAGTVKDYAGLDGCNLLIVAENGDILLPSKLPQGVTLQADQRIRFGYKAGEDMASTCMAEDKIVEITCLEVINN